MTAESIRGNGPLSVAYLLESTELFGGVKVALLQAEALARRGHRVTVVSPAARAGLVSADPRPLRALRVHRTRRPWRTRRCGSRRSGGPCGLALAGAAGPVFHLCQGFEGEITFYKDRWDEIEAIYREPTRKLAITATLAQRLSGLGFGPVADVGQAFDGSDFFPGPERPAADPPQVLVVGPVEIDFKGVEVALAGLEIWRRKGGRFRLRRVSYFPCGEAERKRGDRRRVPPPALAGPDALRVSRVGPLRRRLAGRGGLRPARARGPRVRLADPALRRAGAAGDRRRRGLVLSRRGPRESGGGAPRIALRLGPRAGSRRPARRRAARYDAARVAERLEQEFREALGAGAAS